LINYNNYKNLIKFINFKLKTFNIIINIFNFRYHENDRVRHIFERFISLNQHPKNWIKYSKFEEQNHEIGKNIIILLISLIE